jgi:DNA (cytosine-5)-methyltransferase 1
VAKLEPLAFLMENVPGLTQMGVEGQVLEDLELRGAYRVTAQVLDAADFGVPQTRRRLVFLGIRRSLGPDPPALAGTGATDALLWVRRESKSGRPRYDITERREHPGYLRRLLDAEDISMVTAEQAISDFEMLRAGTREDVLSTHALPPAASAYQRLMREGLGEILANTSVPRINADTVMRLAGLPPGGNYRDLSVELQERYLTGALWGPSNGTGQLGRRHYYAYRRLHPSGFSWTLNTKADSVYHYRARRALSVREFARIQSFPDRFVFTTDPRRGELPGRIDGGAGHSRYRQAGNAVPPLLAQAVATALLAAIAGGLRARRTA